MIHDDSDKVGVGGMIFIKSTRPISKKKVWVVVNKEKQGE
jgi:ribosomal protein S17